MLQLPTDKMITLRRTEELDLDYVLSAEHSPENRAYVTQWLREKHLAVLTDPDIAHLIVEAEKRVGYIILAGLQDPNETIELRRIVITKKGFGYGKAALQQVKQQAFEQYQAHRLWLDVKEHNHRAQALYKSAGFMLEGTLRQCLKTENGHYESLLLMSILREEYRVPSPSKKNT
jgi:diamine N-acetyltransferase